VGGPAGRPEPLTLGVEAGESDERPTGGGGW
jgi:hypothetical protein